ncbi:hypothetical protein LPN04_12120 [Rugamonas sp. A1-17]|nr:hypothetical protein [Rugamonas sp. A1-17]
MHNTIFKNIKPSLSVSMRKFRITSIKENQDISALTDIQDLPFNEYSTVTGGPQVQNEPER